MSSELNTIHYSTKNLIRRIAEYNKPFWPQIALLFLLNLLATPIALLKPYALKLLIDSGFGSQKVPGFITPIASDPILPGLIWRLLNLAMGIFQMQH